MEKFLKEQNLEVKMFVARELVGLVVGISFLFCYQHCGNAFKTLLYFLLGCQKTFQRSYQSQHWRLSCNGKINCSNIVLILTRFLLFLSGSSSSYIHSSSKYNYVSNQRLDFHIFQHNCIWYSRDIQLCSIDLLFSFNSTLYNT